MNFNCLLERRGCDCGLPQRDAAIVGRNSLVQVDLASEIVEKRHHFLNQPYILERSAAQADAIEASGSADPPAGLRDGMRYGGVESGSDDRPRFARRGNFRDHLPEMCGIFCKM